MQLGSLSPRRRLVPLALMLLALAFLVFNVKFAPKFLAKRIRTKDEEAEQNAPARSPAKTKPFGGPAGPPKRFPPPARPAAQLQPSVQASFHNDSRAEPPKKANSAKDVTEKSTSTASGQAIADHALPASVPQSILDSADPASSFQTEEWNFRRLGSLRKLKSEKAVDAGHAYTLWDRLRWEKRGGTPMKAFHVKPNKNPAKIRQIWIWGERNSCTTLITALLRSNFGSRLACGKKLCVRDGLKWKHAPMREANLTEQDSTLHLLVTRHPYEWLSSMHSHPFYAALHYGRSMSDFLTLEWLSFLANRQPSQGQRPDIRPRDPEPTPQVQPMAAGELKSDRDPDSGRRLPTIMAMREAKIRDFFHVAKTLDFTGHVACRDFFLHPVDSMRRVGEAFGLQREDSEWRLGSCVLEHGMCKEKESGWDDPPQKRSRLKYLSGSHVQKFDAEALGIANAWADPVLEAHLGYQLFPDLETAALPYNQETRCSVHLPDMWKAAYCPRQPAVRALQHEGVPASP